MKNQEVLTIVEEITNLRPPENAEQFDLLRVLLKQDAKAYIRLIQRTAIVEGFPAIMNDLPVVFKYIDAITLFDAFEEELATGPKSNISRFEGLFTLLFIFEVRLWGQLSFEMRTTLKERCTAHLRCAFVLRQDELTLDSISERLWSQKINAAYADQNSWQFVRAVFFHLLQDMQATDSLSFTKFFCYILSECAHKTLNQLTPHGLLGLAAKGFF